MIGIPGFQEKEFLEYSRNNCSKISKVSECSAALIRGLNVTLPWDPQELELLGSQAIGNASQGWTQTCFVFGDKFRGLNVFRSQKTRSHQFAFVKVWNASGWTDVTPSSPYQIWDEEGFCGTEDTRKGSLGAYGVTFLSEDKTPALWNNNTAKALPPGIFLICGDRAWQGIPKNVNGGPCYLGKLTMFAPHLADLRNILQVRNKRSIGLTPSCNDNVELLSRAARISLAIFVPGAAAGNALKNLERLACWSEKQANATTEVLDQMLLDQDSLRHALLQNRAAIDFLLLAQGHGCEDFEGMCCLNLTSHSESIHKSIAWLKQHTSKIQKETSVFDDWLRNLFGDIPGWLNELIKEGLKILLLLVVMILCISIAFSCIKKVLTKMMNQVWVAQKKKGGIVEEFLAERGGHDLLELSNQAFDSLYIT